MARRSARGRNAGRHFVRRDARGDPRSCPTCPTACACSASTTTHEPNGICRFPDFLPVICPPVPSPRRGAHRHRGECARLACLGRRDHAGGVERVFADVKRPQRVLAPTELPEVEPLQIQDLDPGHRRCQRPVRDGPQSTRAPFAGGRGRLVRAADCSPPQRPVTEADDDAVGRRRPVADGAGRLRRPPSLKTVCGVVAQGAERSTGGFTFTCGTPGALARLYFRAAMMDFARRSGYFAEGCGVSPGGLCHAFITPAGLCPCWSASLDKIAEVTTHLFFRWIRWWGTPRRSVAQSRRRRARRSPSWRKCRPVRRLGGALEEAEAAVATAAPYLGAVPDPLTEAPDTYPSSWPECRRRLSAPSPMPPAARVSDLQVRAG